MGRKRKGNKVDGWLVIDKPLGMTSTQVVGKCRWVTKAQKIGHGGTLDPLASGILPIACGEATKTIPFIMDARKIYVFTVTFGESRSTDDAEGEIVATSDHRPGAADITEVLPEFIGCIQQTPPAYSAIKIDGKRAYDLARAGEDFEIKSRNVDIFDLKMLSLDGDQATLQVTCGKGTYVRSLARDLALRLNTVTEEQATLLSHGQALSVSGPIESGIVRAMAGERLVALCETDQNPDMTILRPVRVFNF